VNYPFKFNKVNQTETSFPNENLQYILQFCVLNCMAAIPPKIKEPSNERLVF